MVKHGGLSRAGKVKRQTPKACTQDKPKSLTGRNKKRVQFNRRMNVSAVGPRRGPNSNA